MKLPRLTRSLIFKAIAVVCLCLFIYLVLKMDPRRIWASLRSLGWTDWMILMGLRFVFWILRSVNWHIVMRQYDRRLSLKQAFSARIAGNAVGYLTPVTKLGGEAVRILMIDGLSKPALTASAVVDKTIEFLATLLFIISSVVILISNFPMSGPQKIVILGSLTAATAFLLGFLYLQKKGIFTWALEGLGKLRIRFSGLESQRGSFNKTDAYISEFYQKNTRVFLGVFLLYLIWVLLWVLEIYLSFIFLGTTEVSWLQCYLLVTLGSLAYLVPALPAALGTYELTYFSLFALLSIDLEAGIAVILVRRVIGLLWALIGVIPLIKKGSGGIRKRGSPDASTG